MSDVERLRAVAEAATRGPWEALHDLMPTGVVGDHPPAPSAVARVGINRVLAGVWSEADAEHIATFDPPTVLALLDRLAAAEGAVAQAWAEGWQTGYDDSAGLADNPYRAALAPAPTDDVAGAQRGGEGA